MKKLAALLLGLCLLLATMACHFHGYSGHPHGMPPGQAKKVFHPAKMPVKHPARKHAAKPWK